MQIRYSVSTMVFWWREHPLSFEQECQFLRSLGFGIELWPNIRGQDECRYERRNWPRLLSATAGMPVSMRSQDGSPTIQQWAEQIECAKLLKANIITNSHALGIPDGAQVNGCGFAADIVSLADENNVKLCIETGCLNTIRQIGKKFKSLWFCLDTGFANIDPQFSFKQYVDHLAERTIHLHLTDNYGQIDDHEPPGLRGGIARKNWDYLLNAITKYDNDVTGSFEMIPCMPASMVRRATEFLFDELNWPNRPKKQPDSLDSAYNPQ